MKKRKKREIVPTDMADIEENVRESAYSDEEKEKLKLQAIRLNELMVSNQISIAELVEKTNVSQGAISQYRTGKVLIKEELLQPICYALGVSENYLRGISEVKKYENEELNKMFGLSDKSISTIKSLENKKALNYIFENDSTIIDYLLDSTKKYLEVNKKLLDYEAKYDGDRLEYDEEYIELLRDNTIEKFNVMEIYSMLIDEEARRRGLEWM